jgi:hypothetical protein
MLKEQNEKFSFNSDPEVVNVRLHEATIEFGDQQARIRDTTFFSREENEGGQYTIMLETRPGVIVGVPLRGSTLPLVSTKDGTCIKIDELEVIGKGNKRIEGPGRVARALALQTGEVREIKIIDPNIPILRVL